MATTTRTRLAGTVLLLTTLTATLAGCSEADTPAETPAESPATTTDDEATDTDTDTEATGDEEASSEGETGTDDAEGDDEAGADDGATSVSVNDLAAGDCFDLPTDTDEVDAVPVVDCDQPHDNEVFHTFDLTGEEFPGDAEVEAEAEQPCLDAFATYVGIDYDSSRLEVFPITPTQESWDQGDRRVICALRDPGGQLEGSMEGAAE